MRACGDLPWRGFSSGQGPLLRECAGGCGGCGSDGADQQGERRALPAGGNGEPRIGARSGGAEGGRRMADFERGWGLEDFPSCCCAPSLPPFLSLSFPFLLSPTLCFRNQIHILRPDPRVAAGSDGAGPPTRILRLEFIGVRLFWRILRM